MSLFDNSPLYQLLQYENAGLSRFLLDATATGFGIAISTDPVTAPESSLKGHFFLCIYDPLSDSLCYLPPSLKQPSNEYLTPLKKIWDRLHSELAIPANELTNHLLLPFAKLASAPLQAESSNLEIPDFSWHGLLELNSLQKLPVDRPEKLSTPLLRAQSLVEIAALNHFLGMGFTLDLLCANVFGSERSAEAFKLEVEKYLTKFDKLFYTVNTSIAMPGTYLGRLTLVLPKRFKSQTAPGKPFRQALDLRLQQLIGSLRLFQSLRAASLLKESIKQQSVQIAMHCIFGRKPQQNTPAPDPFQLNVDDASFSVMADISLPATESPAPTNQSAAEIKDYRDLCAWQLGTAIQANVRAAPTLQQVLIQWMKQQFNGPVTLDNDTLTNHIEVAYLLAAMALKLIANKRLNDTSVLTSIFVINFSKRIREKVTVNLPTAFTVEVTANGWFQGIGGNVRFDSHNHLLDLSCLKSDTEQTLPAKLTVIQSRKLAHLDPLKSPTQLINGTTNIFGHSERKSTFCDALKTAGFKFAKTPTDLVLIYPANGNLRNCSLQVA